MATRSSSVVQRLGSTRWASAILRVLHLQVIKISLSSPCSSARSHGDGVLRPVLHELWADNYCVYGARRLGKAARRACVACVCFITDVLSRVIVGWQVAGSWKSVEDVELATLGWVHWYNTARLPRLRSTHRFRDDVLRLPRDRPTPGRNPQARATVRLRTVHTPSIVKSP